MHPATAKFNQKLILSALGNIDEWEVWADTVPTGAAKVLNLSLIRLVKGLVKAWRLYLIEQGQQQATVSSRTYPPPSDSHKEVVTWQNGASLKTRT